VAKDPVSSKLVLFIHDPGHSDQMIRENVDRARRVLRIPWPPRKACASIVIRLT